MAYGPTSPLGGSRIFYSSTYILGLWPLFYSGKWIFAKSNIRISLSLSPGEPLIIDDRLLHVKTLKILSAVTREFVSVAFAIPYHRNIPMDKYIHLSFLLLFPVDLVIGRYPEILSIDPRILCAYCLAVPFHLNTPTDNFSPLSSIHSSPVVHVFHNGLWNTIRSSKIPQ